MKRTTKQSRTKGDRFGVFIISHGRPHRIRTTSLLARSGYTGEIRIVCDDEDSTLAEYEKAHPGKVMVFDKRRYASMVDSCDNFNNRRTTTHARNACFDLAREVGWDFFLVLDDDYTDLIYLFDSNWKFKRRQVYEFDAIVKAFVEMLRSNERISSVCMLQNGDLIGGEKALSLNRSFPFRRRKAMNTFFCATNRRFWFHSRLNEDVNTFLTLGREGHIFLTIPEVMMKQSPTQGTAGGMTTSYLNEGTYVKAFYSVMLHPSCVVAAMIPAMGRIHHQISWNHAVPKILHPSLRK